MSEEFRRLAQESRRLTLLRLLTESGDTSNTSVLQEALCRLGHVCSRDQVVSDAAWLAEVGLVEMDHLGPVTVVRLTGRGDDVACGRTVVPGVAKPRPRS